MTYDYFICFEITRPSGKKELLNIGMLVERRIKNAHDVREIERRLQNEFKALNITIINWQLFN